MISSNHKKRDRLSCRFFCLMIFPAYKRAGSVTDAKAAVTCDGLRRDDGPAGNRCALVRLMDHMGAKLEQKSQSLTQRITLNLQG
jgi:hypothetical protein